MADISKPVYGEVWANAGERLLPPATKIENGWIQEMMPFQYENWIQHRQDMALVYLFQKGVSEWSSEQEYIADKSVVTYLGNLYMATLTTTNVVPTVTTSWKRLNSNSSPDGVISIAGGGTGATSAASARTNLGLGTMATQNANAVAITGGTITSITAAGAFTGNLVGNASTATAMQTARTFAITGAALADPVSFNATANVLLNVLSLDATKLTGVATINTTGNAATATVLQTARTITLSGAATGSPTSFNGSGDISIPVVSLNATDLLTGTVPTGRLGNAVTKTSATGSAQIPVGTTAQRDVSPVVGSVRFNSSNSNLMEYWNGTSWITSNGTDLGGLIGSGPTQISTNAMNDARYQSLAAAAAMSVADRERSNHTGIQAQTTIDGLVPRLTTIESNITSLDQSVSTIEADVSNKQDTLVSGTNIKTINGASILGSGNIIASDSPVGTVYMGRQHPLTGTWLDTGSYYLQSNYPELFTTLGLVPSPASWTNRNAAGMVAVRGIAYGNNTYVAVGLNGSSASFGITSPDGITWTARTVNAVEAVAFGAGVFISLGTNAVRRSTDGITWTNGTIPAGAWVSVTYGGGLFVAVGSNTIVTSPDGITWTARTGGLISATNVSYGDSKFIITSPVGGGALSTDGINWTPLTLPSGLVYDVKYGNGVWVAVGGNGALTSTDAINWTQRQMPKVPGTGVNYRSLTYYNGRFVAVGSISTGNPVCAESPDGISWTELFMPAGGYSCIISENGLLVSGGTLIQTAPMFPYDTATQFYTPLVKVPVGIKAWIKAGD